MCHYQDQYLVPSFSCNSSLFCLFSLWCHLYHCLSWCHAIFIFVRSWNWFHVVVCVSHYGATLGHGSIVIVMQNYCVVLVPPWAKFSMIFVWGKEMSVSGFEPQSTGQQPRGLTSRPLRLLCFDYQFRWLESSLAFRSPGCVFCSFPHTHSVMISFEFASIWNRGSYSYLLLQWIPLACSGALPMLGCSFYEFEHAVGNSNMSAPIAIVVA